MPLDNSDFLKPTTKPKMHNGNNVSYDNSSSNNNTDNNNGDNSSNKNNNSKNDSKDKGNNNNDSNISNNDNIGDMLFRAIFGSIIWICTWIVIRLVSVNLSQLNMNSKAPDQSQNKLT